MSGFAQWFINNTVYRLWQATLEEERRQLLSEKEALDQKVKELEMALVREQERFTQLHNRAKTRLASVLETLRHLSKIANLYII
jgi:hypothetical protein